MPTTRHSTSYVTEGDSVMVSIDLVYVLSVMFRTTGASCPVDTVGSRPVTAYVADSRSSCETILIGETRLHGAISE